MYDKIYYIIYHVTPKVTDTFCMEFEEYFKDIKILIKAF